MGRVVIPGFRKIETSGGGGEGTTNYNKLTNKPSINNVLLVGNLRTVDLKLTDETLTEEGVPAEAKTVGTKLEEQSSNLTSEISRAKETEETLKSRIDNIASLPEGSTTGDAELQDIRVGDNGVTYDNAGNAVRGQFSDLKGQIGELKGDLVYQNSDLDMIKNDVYSKKITSLPNAKTTTPYEFIKGKKYKINIRFNDATTVQVGTRLTVDAPSYIDSTPILSGSPIDYDFTFIASENAHVLYRYQLPTSATLDLTVEEVGELALATKEDLNILKFNLGGIYSENNVALSKSTYVFLNKQNNSRKVKGFKFYANKIGRLYYYHFKDDGNGKIYTDKLNYFDVKKVGINFVKLDIELRENEYLGFSSQVEILTYANVPINSYNQIGVRQELCFENLHYTFTSFIKTNYALNVEIIFDDSLITRIDNIEKNNFDFLRCFTTFTGIGDSLMGGYTSDGNNTVGTAIAREKKNNWLEYMCSRLNRECHNLAVGSSTAENWRYVNQSTTNESDIEKANITTSCYIIGIGVNDLRLNNTVGTSSDIKNDYTQNSNTFYGNYDYLIRKMKSFNPYAKIFALTIPRSETGKNLEGINNAIRYICSLYTNVYCIDLSAISNYDTDFIANNFSNGHYNPITYNYMSVIIENEINKYIYDNYGDFKWIPYDFN